MVYIMNPNNIKMLDRSVIRGGHVEMFFGKEVTDNLFPFLYIFTLTCIVVSVIGVTFLDNPKIYRGRFNKIIFSLFSKE